MTTPPTYISVIGGSVCSPEIEALAERLGGLLAQRGCVVVCGGQGGVMQAVARGVKQGGGLAIGVMPALDRSAAAPELAVSICTGIGHARNLAVVASGQVVIAVGGAWGTLSEIGLARAIGRPVVALRSWHIHPYEGELDGVHPAESADDAVELAFALLPPAAR
jgi:uncharacterized protein (TIGR00725 family)